MFAISIIGGCAIGIGCFLLGIYVAYLLVGMAYRDSEKGLYKPSNDAIIEKHEQEMYHPAETLHLN